MFVAVFSKVVLMVLRVFDREKIQPFLCVSKSKQDPNFGFATLAFVRSFFYIILYIKKFFAKK